MLADIFGADGLIVVAVIAVVLLFGGAKLPQLARGLGSASHEFKKGLADGEDSTTALPTADGALARPAEGDLAQGH